MNIGIDVDGVILDSETRFRAFAEIFDIENLQRGKVNPKACTFQEIFDWDNETSDRFIDTYGYNVEKTAPLKPCAKYVIDWLKDQGHRLIVITARGKWGKEEERITYETFEKFGLTFDKVILNAKDKSTICLQENIDYMIDDMPRNIISISKGGTKCLHFREVGEEVIEDNVTSVSSWAEIYKFFLKLK